MEREEEAKRVNLASKRARTTHDRRRDNSPIVPFIAPPMAPSSTFPLSTFSDAELPSSLGTSGTAFDLPGDWRRPYFPIETPVPPPPPILHSSLWQNELPAHEGHHQYTTTSFVSPWAFSIATHGAPAFLISSSPSSSRPVFLHAALPIFAPPPQTPESLPPTPQPRTHTPLESLLSVPLSPLPLLGVAHAEVTADVRSSKLESAITGVPTETKSTLRVVSAPLPLPTSTLTSVKMARALVAPIHRAVETTTLAALTNTADRDSSLLSSPLTLGHSIAQCSTCGTTTATHIKKNDGASILPVACVSKDPIAKSPARTTDAKEMESHKSGPRVRHKTISGLTLHLQFLSLTYATALVDVFDSTFLQTHIRSMVYTVSNGLKYHGHHRSCHPSIDDGESKRTSGMPITPMTANVDIPTLLSPLLQELVRQGIVEHMPNYMRVDLLPQNSYPDKNDHEKLKRQRVLHPKLAISATLSAQIKLFIGHSSAQVYFTNRIASKASGGTPSATVERVVNLSSGTLLVMRDDALCDWQHVIVQTPPCDTCPVIPSDVTTSTVPDAAPTPRSMVSFSPPRSPSPASCTHGTSPSSLTTNYILSFRCLTASSSLVALPTATPTKDETSDGLLSTIDNPAVAILTINDSPAG